MHTYVLPDLPYDCSALEPFVSGRLVELHHHKHHAAYVKGANSAREALEDARTAGDAAKIARLTQDLAFNVAGHVNHSLFWKNLSPDGGGEPTGMLAQAIAANFGSFEAFKAHFGTLATSVQGSGWVMLAHDLASDVLSIYCVHDHQHGLPAGSHPLLVLDLWEHAYYLDYHNDRPAFVRAFWNVVNWNDVAMRLSAPSVQF